MKIQHQPDMSILVSSIEKRTKGYMDKRVSVFLDKDVKIDLDADAFELVDTLPSVSEAKEGVFYILPNNTLNYVSNGEWKTISGGGGTVASLTDEEWNALWNEES